jgi:hypothetical protein
MTAVHREGHFRFEIISPSLGSVTLPGDPNAWVVAGKQSGWYSFEYRESKDVAQYVNSEKDRWEFYTTDLTTNERFLNRYYEYEWENGFYANHRSVKRMEIVEKEINEDADDYSVIVQPAGLWCTMTRSGGPAWEVNRAHRFSSGL